MPMYWNEGSRSVFLLFLEAKPSSINNHSTTSSPFWPPNSYTSLILPLTIAKSLTLWGNGTCSWWPYVVSNPFSPSFLACWSAIICKPKHHCSFCWMGGLFLRSSSRSWSALGPYLVLILSLKILPWYWLSSGAYLCRNSCGLLRTWLMRLKVVSMTLSISIVSDIITKWWVVANKWFKSMLVTKQQR